MKTLFAALILASAPAFADMDIPVRRVTAYSGHCAYDHYGGGKTASDGEIVTNHTVETARFALREATLAGSPLATYNHANYAIAAVPQARSQTAGIYRCFFRDDQNYKGITFKAADHYGSGSNGLEKYDAAHTCQPGLNGMSKPATVITVEGSCGGVRGGTGDEIQRRHRHPARRKKA
jgi:hypothetical protein